MIIPAVIFEDSSLIVIDKPAGMSSEVDVPAALRARWGSAAAYVGIVHRLDTGVSGLMACAKTRQAAAELSRRITQSQNAYAVLDGRAEAGEGGFQLSPPAFVKKYRAVIAGVPDGLLPQEGILRDFLFKDGRTGRVYPVKRPRRGVKEAVLEYRVTATVQNAAGQGTASLAEITLHTGRTHQIRVQFASRRHPLWGDGKYGSRQNGGIALQSAYLVFPHPVTGEAMQFALPAPDGVPWSDFI